MKKRRKKIYLFVFIAKQLLLFLPPPPPPPLPLAEPLAARLALINSPNVYREKLNFVCFQPIWLGHSVHRTKLNNRSTNLNEKGKFGEKKNKNQTKAQSKMN